MSKNKTISVSPMGVYNSIFTYKSFFNDVTLKNTKLLKNLPTYPLFRRQFLLFSPIYNPANFSKTINELVPSISDIYRNSFSTAFDKKLSQIAPIDIILPPGRLLESLKTPKTR
jgi:hypothetical protein